MPPSTTTATRTTGQTEPTACILPAKLMRSSAGPNSGRRETTQAMAMQ
jgi:hypothetical protein